MAKRLEPAKPSKSRERVPQKTETTLGGTWEVGEGIEDDRGGLDLAVGESAKRDMLDGCDADQGVLLYGTIINAVESDDQGERRRRRMDVTLGHCNTGSNSHL
ncbi:hypothetical protein FEM48_Zijuj02G0133200 [Ziziphus jujuba var. spinosa]|uniref:Uncharacterized protein n=1 Tax=Ziziphus jujuba var. spinosa TaxID=714518 RepID=A0A978VVY5_ZIZJJ|nr:hypothetical protein FEM48_Zijuj02G0133200 [Ziziphus jujuba var. spinosa]